jgi:hypothetical protein
LGAGGKRESGAEEIQLRKEEAGRLKAPFLSRTSLKLEWSVLGAVVADGGDMVAKGEMGDEL